MSTKYTIVDIDRMRRTLNKWYRGEYSEAYKRNSEIEDRLRTYMLNGTTPEELEAELENIVTKYDRAYTWDEVLSGKRPTI